MENDLFFCGEWLLFQSHSPLEDGAATSDSYPVSIKCYFVDIIFKKKDTRRKLRKNPVLIFLQYVQILRNNSSYLASVSR